MKVILLAAGRGRRFGNRTKALPKCLIPLGPGKNLLFRYLDAFRSLGLRKVYVVVGHEKEKIKAACLEKGRDLTIYFIENSDYKKGGIVSLQKAAHELNDDCLIMDADVFFETKSLKKLVQKNRSAFLMDPKSKSTGEEMMLTARGARLVRISKKVDPRLRVVGEATGFFKITKRDAPFLGEILNRMVLSGKIHLEYEEAYNEFMKKRNPCYVPIEGFWMEMDFEEDLWKIKNASLSN